MRTRAERRHHRWRVITRRVRLTRTVFAYPPEGPSEPGRLATWNLVCSCGLCRAEKHRDRRQRHEAEARALAAE